MPTDFLIFLAVGFGAQLVDGALGMAFGTLSTTFLLAHGVPPAQASAAVHTAEVFTTGASGLSHLAHRNIDWKLFARLAPAGIVGGAIGAYLLAQLPADPIRPVVAAYLFLMGALIVAKATRKPVDREPLKHGVVPLGVAGGALDAMGGGGWGPIVVSTLLGTGHTPRYAIGSVNLAEFLVTLSVSVTFFLHFGFSHGYVVLGLIAGGMLAAPFGAWIARHVPARPFMAVVGLLIMGLSAFQVWQLTH